MSKNNLVEKLLTLPRREKRALALGVDTALCLWTVWAALYLRLEEWIWPAGNHWLSLFAAPLIAIPIFVRGGLYRAIFRHTGWPAMIAVSRACLIYGAIYALIFTFIGVPGIPRTIGLIQPVLLFLCVAAVRAGAHVLLGGNYRRVLTDEMLPNVLIYGAGGTGRQLAEAVNASRQMRVAGFIDDDRSLQGATVSGVMIHAPNQIQSLVHRHGVTDVLLAVPTATRARRREILELLRPGGVNVRTLPGLLELAQGHIQISELRSIEIEDLLGRDAVAPKAELLDKNIAGKVVLVTGGGGSIGSELCRQILDSQPRALLIVDSSEFALYAIHRELEARKAPRKLNVPLIPLLASVLDETRMAAIFESWRPQTIYHAAAYKHVTLVEQNVSEGLKNNVFGTLAVAKLAEEFGVADFVLISTDKAVRPTNVMGASKRLAEMVLQAMAARTPATRFSMVRFGNVLGSSGSVVPLFRQQIGGGGPVTITHPDVTRYFMTIPEAAQLVLQAGAMADGGDVFVLDMGEPVKIHELAVNMIELSGLSVKSELQPEGDIEISVIGLRPGEKLYEELLIGNDPLPTEHQRIMRARETCPEPDAFDRQLFELSDAITHGKVEAVLSILRNAVPEYKGGVVVDLVAALPDLPAMPVPADVSDTALVYHMGFDQDPKPGLALGKSQRQ